MPSQPVAPQPPSLVMQAAAQQFPEPSTPQIPGAAHCELAEHGRPAASAWPVLAPPVVTAPPVVVPPVAPDPAVVLELSPPQAVANKKAPAAIAVSRLRTHHILPPLGG